MGKNIPLISLVLPTYNERENIVDFINEAILYISKYAGSDFEILMVDDDSPDKTWEEAQKYFLHDPRIRVLRRTEKRCLALSIRKGIKESRGSVVCWMDCDFSMPAYKLVELIQKVNTEYDIAVGSRFIKGGKDIRGPADSWLVVLLSRLMNCFISFVLGANFKDYSSGFVAAKRKIFEKVEIHGDYGEYFIDFIYQTRKYGYKIIEIPYYCLPRRRGASKTGNNLAEYIQKGWKYIFLTLKLRF